MITVVISAVVAKLQGSFLARRGASRPYAAPLAAAAAVLVAGAAAGGLDLGLGAPMLIGAVVEIGVIALITMPRSEPAARP